MLRLFIAINFSDDQLLTSVKKRLKDKLIRSNVKWVEDKNFHLTLKFLGNTEEYFINSISQVLAKISENHRQFSLQYTDIGYFGSISKPTVIWYRFEGHPTLLALNSEIEKSMTELGFGCNENKFLPHITIGRVKQFEERDIFRNELISKPIINKQVSVSEICLFNSVLHKQGPEYSIIQSFSLSK